MSLTKEKEYLVLAKQLMSKANLSKHRAARDKAGNPVNVFSESAAAYCITGCITRACDMDISAFKNIYAKLETCIREYYPDTKYDKPMHWNDEPLRVKGDVLKMLDRLMKVYKIQPEPQQPNNPTTDLIA